MMFIVVIFTEMTATLSSRRGFTASSVSPDPLKADDF